MKDATSAELARHIDRPEQRHRCVLLDNRRLRCLDCSQTVALPSTPRATSTSSLIPEQGEARCDLHPFERGAPACRSCAADAKAAPNTPDGRPLAGWAVQLGAAQ